MEEVIVNEICNFVDENYKVYYNVQKLKFTVIKECPIFRAKIFSYDH